MNYAGFWRRLAAYLLDIIPITVAAAGIAYLFFGFDETLSAYLHERSLENRVQFLHERNNIRNWAFVVWLFYCMVLEASPLQGTFGKAVFRIQVVDQDGNRLTPVNSIYRNLAKLSAYLSLSIGFLWVIFSKQNQAWHDTIAKTYVVDR